MSTHHQNAPDLPPLVKTNNDGEPLTPAEQAKLEKFEMVRDVALVANEKGKCGIASVSNGPMFMEKSVGFLSDAHVFWMELFLKFNKPHMRAQVARKHADLELKKALRRIPPNKRALAKVALADRGIGLKQEDQTSH